MDCLYDIFVIQSRKGEVLRMTNEQCVQYSCLVEFLGRMLGPDYEITLYDLETSGNPLVAIANGKLGGRSAGESLPEIAIRQIQNGENEQFVLNIPIVLEESGKTIRFSAMRICDRAGKAVGLLGIGFDDSRYLSLCSNLFDLIHPDAYVESQYLQNNANLSDVLSADAKMKAKPSDVYNDVTSMAAELFSDAVSDLQMPVDRLTQDERIALLRKLQENGMFRLKGAVQYVAERLGCSQASIYRYLSKVRYS